MLSKYYFLPLPVNPFLPSVLVLPLWACGYNSQAINAGLLSHWSPSFPEEVSWPGGNYEIGMGGEEKDSGFPDRLAPFLFGSQEVSGMGGRTNPFPSLEWGVGSLMMNKWKDRSWTSQHILWSALSLAQALGFLCFLSSSFSFHPLYSNSPS